LRVLTRPCPSDKIGGMKNTLKQILVVAAFGLSACAVTPSVLPEDAPAGNYKLDPQHTSVLFSLSHSGLSQYTGRFEVVSGELDFNPQAPEQSQLDITIDPKSVSTGLPDFDEKLKTDGKYFDSEKFDTIRFVSTSIQTTGESTGVITGDLYLKGAQGPVTLDVTFNGAGKSFGHPGKTLGFSATGTFNRSEFNMGHLTNFGIGDEITLRIETEFNEAL